MAARLTIVPELLIKNLTALPTEKQDENFENLKTHSPGAAYLCEKILFPLIHGEKLNTRDLYISAKNYAKKCRLLKKQNLYNGG